MQEIFFINYYETDSGRCPYLEWENSLSNDLKAVVRKRMNRVRLGNFGDVEPVGNGISELKFHLGAGYRVYFGKKGIKLLFFYVQD
jgi:putative addiction module killer protein